MLNFPFTSSPRPVVRSAVAAVALAGAAFSASAAHGIIVPPDIGQRKALVYVASEVEDLYERGLLPDPNGQLVHERMPDEKTSHVFERLRQISFADPFLPVGKLRISKRLCTATWLGEEKGFTYLLTAAHCLESRPSTKVPVNASFQGWDDRVLAEGDGTAFILDENVGLSGDEMVPGTDIAILKLPTQRKATDRAGLPMKQPLLDDTDASSYVGPVHLVGYGFQSAFGISGWTTGRWWGETWMSPGALRTAGKYREAEVDRIDADSRRWSSAERGDSGSGWWQPLAGYWRVIAVTSNGTVSHGTYGDTQGPVIADHIDWIRGIYAGVKTFSSQLVVEPMASRGQFVSACQWGDGTGDVYFSVSEKGGTRSVPLSSSALGKKSGSLVYTTVMDKWTNDRREVKLRLVSLSGEEAQCQPSRATTGKGVPTAKRFALSFEPKDNSSLPPGSWTGKVDVEIRRSPQNKPVETLSLEVRWSNDFPRFSEGRLGVRPRTGPLPSRPR